MKQTQTSGKTDFSIHPATKIGPVSLTVANLDNQIAFYQGALGFRLHRRDGRETVLGTEKRELLHLAEQPDFKRYRGVTGLYHFAVLFPDRRELARAVARLLALEYRNYPTDQIMTKTTYLDDPEGNGIECFTDSPFHVAQPHASGLVLDGSDEEIEAATRDEIESLPEFAPIEEWRRAFTEQLGAAASE